MKYLAALLFFIDIGMAIPEGMPDAWWPDEWGMPCTLRSDRELASCNGLEVRKPKWGKKRKKQKGK